MFIYKNALVIFIYLYTINYKIYPVKKLDCYTYRHYNTLLCYSITKY